MSSVFRLSINLSNKFGDDGFAHSMAAIHRRLPAVMRTGQTAALRMAYFVVVRAAVMAVAATTPMQVPIAPNSLTHWPDLPCLSAG
jgi:hypothetical protein